MATCQTNNQMRYMRRTNARHLLPVSRNSSYERMSEYPGLFPCKYADCNGICSMAKMAEHL